MKRINLGFIRNIVLLVGFFIGSGAFAADSTSSDTNEWFKVVFKGGIKTDVGGGWSVPKSGFATVSVTNGVTAYVLKEVVNLDFLPTSGSSNNVETVIEGKAMVTVSDVFPVVASDTVAGLCFAPGVKVYGCGSDGWQELSGTTLAVGSWVDYRVSVSPEKGLITYAVNGVTLAPSLPLASGTECLTSLRYGGTGAISDIRGYVVSGGVSGEVVLERPELLAEGGFVATGESFTLTVSKPVVGAYYTLFTTESLNEPFVAQPGCIQCVSADQMLQFSFETDTPSKFAMIVTSLTPIAPNSVRAGD